MAFILFFINLSKFADKKRTNIRNSIDKDKYTFYTKDNKNRTNVLKTFCSLRLGAAGRKTADIQKQRRNEG